MDIETHYYITGIVAWHAGFNKSDATTIAWASQFVDDNKLVYDVRDRDSGDVYRNRISQTMNILKPNKKRLTVYPFFHFVPGNPNAASARRRDGLTHPLNTTPDSRLANEMIEAAFSDRPIGQRLYRVGVAAHAYMDSWAHQNYAGFRHTFNASKGNIIPDIGHADDRHKPDRVALVWVDERLVNDAIDNNERFLTAAGRLFEHFSRGRSPRIAWGDLRDILAGVMGTPKKHSGPVAQKARIKQYLDIEPRLPKYAEKKWFNEAIRTGGKESSAVGGSVEGPRAGLRCYWKNGVRPSHTDWYKFQEAVKAHHAFMFPKIAPLCARAGVDIGTE